MAQYDHDFWAEMGEVLLHKRDRELWHVTGRYEDVDADVPEFSGLYRLECDTHTTRMHYNAEDIEVDFMKIGEVVNGKPLQADELEYWYE